MVLERTVLLKLPYSSKLYFINYTAERCVRAYLTQVCPFKSARPC